MGRRGERSHLINYPPADRFAIASPTGGRPKTYKMNRLRSALAARAPMRACT